MARSSNALLALGIVLLVVGGVGLVYGQLMLQEQGNADEGAFVSVDLSSDSGNEENSNARRLRTIRFGGLVLGGVGAVITVTGGLLD